MTTVVGLPALKKPLQLPKPLNAVPSSTTTTYSSSALKIQRQKTKYKKTKDKIQKTKPHNAAPCSITTTYSSFWLKTPEHFLAERQPLFTRSSIQLHYHYIFTTTTIQFLLITRCATATLSQQSLRIATSVSMQLKATHATKKQMQQLSHDGA